MRRIISILLLVVFIYQIAGFHLAFRVLQLQIRRSVKMAIKNDVPSDNLHVFRFSTKDFENLNFLKPDEFLLNSQLFDIVKTQESADTIIVWCVNDKDEEILFAHLEQQIRSSSDWTGKSEKARILSVKWHNDFVYESVNLTTNLSYKSVDFPEFKFLFQEICIPINPKPPAFC